MYGYARTLYRLLHQLVIADELAGSRHARVRHAHCHLHAVEGTAHAGWKVAVLGVRGGFLERPEVVFAFVVFFFAAVAAIGTFRAIASVMGATMSVKHC